MKKRCLIFTIIMLVLALSVAVLVGCDKVVDVGETPTKWDSYTTEIADSYLKTFKDANDSYTLSFDFQLKHVVKGQPAVYDGTFKITQDTILPELSAFELDIYSTSAEKQRERIFYFACNNSSTYLYVKDLNGNYDIKYHFENTPIFTLYRVDLADPAVIKAYAQETIRQMATYCNVNADKSIYTLDFNLQKYISSKESEIDKLLGIIPAPLIEEINEIFNTNVNKWDDVLKGTIGKADITMNSSRCITALRIYDMQSFVSDESMIEEISVTNIKVAKSLDMDRTLCTRIQEDKGDYPKTKLGTLSASGSFELIDSLVKRTAITYDYKFNSSIDLLALAANKFDFATLDDSNYLHLRISHICNSECTAFCSVNYGNKLESGKGAVIDIAFSPRDFGTKYVYISLGLKQIVGEDTIREVAGGAAGLAMLAFPQYVLFTLDTSAYAFQNEQNNGMLLLQFLMGLNSNLSIYSDYMDIDINKILDLAGIERNGLVDSLLNLGGYNIDLMKVNTTLTQFGNATDYDIYREAIHLIDYEYANTKNYNNAIYSPNPSLDWDFSADSGGAESFNVHNIYRPDDQVMYSSGVPISPQEIVNLKGCYINYTYTDIYKHLTNERGDKYKGKATIIDVVGVDKSIVNEYQKVYLKVQLPSKWLGILGNEPIASVANEFLYAFCETNIKLTPIAVNGMTIERTDKENAKVKTEYRLESKKSSLPMLNGLATIKYTNGYTKIIKLVGSCDAVKITQNMLGTNYTIMRQGATSVRLSYAGKVNDFTVNILSPKAVEFMPIYGKTSVLKRNTEYTYTDFSMYYVNMTYLSSDGSKDEQVRYNLDFSDYYINGYSLGVSGAYWDTYLDTDTSAIIKFNVDGEYKVDLLFFDKVYTTNITVTSNVTDKSSYQIMSNNSGGFAAADARMIRSYFVKNRFHGISGLDNLALDIEIYKGSITSSGTILYTEKLKPNNGYRVENQKFDGEPYDSSVPISLPQTIFKPIPITFDIYFAEHGYYRIAVELANNIYVFDYVQVI